VAPDIFAKARASPTAMDARSEPSVPTTITLYVAVPGAVDGGDIYTPLK